MRLHPMRRAALLLLLCVTPVACGDSTGPEDDELTEAEVVALLEALSATGAFDLGVAAGTGGAGGPAAVPISESLSETVPCPEGGIVTLAGTVTGDMDEDTGLGTLSFELTQRHRACKATGSSAGMTFTLDGDPDITMQADMVIMETRFSFSGTQEGRIRWRTGNRRGSCVLDLVFDVGFSSDSGEEITGGVTGTICGHPLSAPLD